MPDQLFAVAEIGNGGVVVDYCAYFIWSTKLKLFGWHKQNKVLATIND